MKFIALCLLTLTLIGCSGNASTTPEVSPGLTQDQLVPTLQKIAETGQYDTVLQDLTVGLENAGHMEQAVTVQRFNELSDPEDIKKLAAQVMKQIQK
jgi:hypothetical protein